MIAQVPNGCLRELLEEVQGHVQVIQLQTRPLSTVAKHENLCAAIVKLRDFETAVSLPLLATEAKRLRKRLVDLLASRS